jgi:hypothetical protein
MLTVVRRRRKQSVDAENDVRFAADIRLRGSGRRLLVQPGENRRRRSIECVGEFAGHTPCKTEVAGIASRTQLDSQLAQPQCPEITCGPEQGVRLPADFLELIAVDKTADLGDAFGSAAEKHFEELA